MTMDAAKSIRLYPCNPWFLIMFRDRKTEVEGEQCKGDLMI
jgi:hypothetical protein